MNNHRCYSTVQTELSTVQWLHWQLMKRAKMKRLMHSIQSPWQPTKESVFVNCEITEKYLRSSFS